MTESGKTPYQQPTVIDQDGNRQVFLAHFWRYHSPDHEEFDTIEEAQAFLFYGVDSGNCAGCCVVWPDGTWAAWDFAGAEPNGSLGERQPFDPKHCPQRQVSHNPPSRESF